MADVTPQQARSARTQGLVCYVAREAAPMLVVLSAAVMLVAGLGLAAARMAEAPGATATETPTPTTGPYDGFRFETVGVGVRRLLDDGHGRRPGDRAFLFGPDPEAIAFEPDGSVLVCCDDPELLIGDTTHSELHRLGDPEPVVSWDDTDLRIDDAAGIAVGAEGRIWLAGTRLASLGPDGWKKHGRLNGAGVLAVAGDGSVWADATDWRGLALAHARPAARTRLVRQDELPARIRNWGSTVTGIAVTPDGHVWIGVGAGKPGSEGGLLRFDGRRWRVVRPLGTGIDARVESLSTAPDGTLWAYLSRDARVGTNGGATRSHLASFDGESWTVHGERDGVPHHGSSHRFEDAPALMAAGPDDAVWLTPVAKDGCRQLVMWREGQTITPLPQAACVEELALAPDGSAWVVVAWDEARGADRWYTELLVVGI